MSTSILDGLLDKLRGKRIERLTSTSEQYDKVLTDLATGKEIDLDELALLMDELDKSDAELKKDVQGKQKRIEAVRRIAELQEIERTIPALRLEAEKAQNELNAALERLRPIAAETGRRLYDAENQISEISFRKNMLRTEGIPYHVQERQNKVKELQLQRRDKTERYEERTKGTQHLPTLKRNLQDVESVISKTKVVGAFPLELRPGDPGERQDAIRKAEKLRRDIENYEQCLATWAPLKAEINELTKQIETEQAEIERLLMIP